jgi:hypothetical protein
MNCGFAWFNSEIVYFEYDTLLSTTVQCPKVFVLVSALISMYNFFYYANYFTLPVY